MSLEYQQFERRSEPTIPTPLEARIPNMDRVEIGRHIASRVFMDGFSVMDKPTSIFEDMRGDLQQRIIGQPAAADAIISALDRWEVRNRNDNRPVATFAFLGPTGVGKSQTAKVLADLVRSGHGNLVRIDCSNYANGYEVASLTGAPPGYVGHGQEAVLNKQSIEPAGTVVLFDEFEKGSEKLFNLLLQILEEGELRLNNGDVTDFRDAIIVLSSNVGAKEMGDLTRDMKPGFSIEGAVKDKGAIERAAIKAFEGSFKTELIGRIDKMVVFQPLSSEEVVEVLGVKLEEINRQYEEDYGVRISLSDATINHLSRIAQKQAHLGARPMVRAFEQHIQTAFGQYTSSDAISEGTHVRVFHRDDFPEDYQHADDRELFFSSKPDRRIKQKAGADLVLYTQQPTLFTQDFIDNA